MFVTKMRTLHLMVSIFLEVGLESSSENDGSWRFEGEKKFEISELVL